MYLSIGLIIVLAIVLFAAGYEERDREIQSQYHHQPDLDEIIARGEEQEKRNKEWWAENEWKVILGVSVAIGAVTYLFVSCIGPHD